MNDAPLTVIDWQRHWCRRHLEPYRNEWPKGAPLAAIMLFQHAVSDERFGDMAGGNAERIGETLDQVAPVCCFLGDEVMAGITDAALRGELDEFCAGLTPKALAEKAADDEGMR